MKRWIILTLTLLLGVLLLGGCQVSEEITYTEIKSNINEDLFFSNPLGISQIGDPFILKASDGIYYCYATSDAAYGFEVWTSSDMVDWVKHQPRVYSSTKDSWGVDDFWAPEVYEWDGKYYLYYSAKWREKDSLRIGLAISDSPLGPFEDVSDQPLFDYDYAVIDAHVFVDDDGQSYLYYSRDCSENKVGLNNESHSYGIRLGDDKQTLVGEPVLLVSPEQSWEMQSGSYRWNEGPYVVKHDAKYYIMYSANYYASKEYSVGYASSDSPLGPFVKSEKNPLLYAKKEEKKVSGSGHNMVLEVPGTELYYLVYHTHSVPLIGGGDRSLAFDLMGFREDGTVFVNGPSISRQLKPDIFERALNMHSNYTVYKNDNEVHALSDYERAVAYSDYELAPVEAIELNDVIELRFDTKYLIESFLIYGGYDTNHTMVLDIVFSNGKMISSLKATENDATQIVASFEPAEVEWIKIYNKGEAIELSEIVVIPSK